MIELTGLDKDFFDLFSSWLSYRGRSKKWEKQIFEDLVNHGGVQDTTTRTTNDGELQLVFIMNDGKSITYIPRHGKGIKVAAYLEKRAKA